MSKKEKEGAKNNAPKKSLEIMGNINIHYFKALLFVLIVTLIFMVMVKLGLDTGWYLITTAIILVYLRFAVVVLESTPPFGYALLRLNSFVRNMFGKIKILEGGFKFFFLTWLLNKPFKIDLSKIMFDGKPGSIGKPFVVTVRTSDGADSNITISDMIQICDFEKVLLSCGFEGGSSLKPENYFRVHEIFQQIVTGALIAFARSKIRPITSDGLMDCSLEITNIIMSDDENSPKKMAEKTLGIRIILLNVEEIELAGVEGRESKILELKEELIEKGIEVQIAQKKAEAQIATAQGEANAMIRKAEGLATSSKIIQEEGNLDGEKAHQQILAEMGKFTATGNMINVGGNLIGEVAKALLGLIEKKEGGKNE